VLAALNSPLTPSMLRDLANNNFTLLAEKVNDNKDKNKKEKDILQVKPRKNNLTWTKTGIEGGLSRSRVECRVSVCMWCDIPRRASPCNVWICTIFSLILLI
jgi:hypothetical protein